MDHIVETATTILQLVQKQLTATTPANESPTRYIPKMVGCHPKHKDAFLGEVKGFVRGRDSKATVVHAAIFWSNSTFGVTVYLCHVSPLQFLDFVGGFDVQEVSFVG